MILNLFITWAWAIIGIILAFSLSSNLMEHIARKRGWGIITKDEIEKAFGGQK